MKRNGGAAPGLLALVLLSAMTMPAAAPSAPPLPVASPASQGFSSERLQRLHRFLQQACAGEGYLGAVSLIARDGKIVDWQAYGHRDLARTDPMQRDSIFRIYSMTKTVTSVAVMQLVEQGRIGVDDPLSRYLPGFSDSKVLWPGTSGQVRAAARPITLHDLLTHTAGLPAGLPGDEEAVQRMERADPHGAADLRGFAERVGRVPLAADPGTRFGYDGAGLELLARVVEVVSGQPFADYLQAHVFEPLRMHDTGFSVPVAQRARIADITRMGDDGRLHIADGPSARTPGVPLNAYPSGAGGLYSTAADYARFAQMLLDGGTLDGRRLLGRKTVEWMLQNHLTMLDPPVNQFSDAEGFGIGGYVVLDPARRGQLGSAGQFGWSGAGSTYFMIDPREHLLAILMLQHLPREDGHADLPRISRTFYDLVHQALE